MTTPSPYTIQQVMALAQAAASRIEAVDMDADDLFAALRDEGADVDTLLLRLLRAGDEAKHAAEAVKERREALAVRQDRYIRNAEECRRTAFAIMDALGISKLRLAEFTVSIAPGRPVVVITDEAALPDDLVRIKREPDKTAIKAALEQGEVVPGAALSNQLPTLTVRTK